MPLRPGSQLRVTTRTGTRLAGRLVELRSDSLYLRTSTATALALLRREVARLEIGRTSRATGTGALAGAILGGTAATLFAIGFCRDPDTSCQADEYARIYGIIALPPVAVGALIGSLVRRTRWELVPLDRLAVRVGWMRAGVVEAGVQIQL
jgi:hypothetical protein